MNRNAFLVLAALAGGTLALGCGENMDTDAGVDGGGGTDTGVDMPDSGPDEPDAGLPDAGPTGCQVDCEFEELSLGLVHSCGRRANGEVLCWGYGNDFQLGDGRTRHENCAPGVGEEIDCSGVPVNVRYQMGGTRPLLTDATQITSEGFTSSCALREGGELWCWSSETVGVMGGIPVLRRVAERDAVMETYDGIHQASVGGGHMCIVHGAERGVLCAGGNSFGQLGLGTGETVIPDARPVVLDGEVTPAAELQGVQEVAVSHGGFTCARTADSLYCWGRNASRQLGTGNSTAHNTCEVTGMMDFPCSRTAVEVGDITAEPPVPLGAVADIAVGGAHACAVRGTAPGQVVCWGDNRFGQVGQPASLESVGLPTAIAGLTNVVQVAAGARFSCALHDDGTISCWGWNEFGQLGDGIDTHETCTGSGESNDCSRTPVSVSTIDDAAFLEANGSHVCAIRGDGSVWCWGQNDNKQLGDGSRTIRSEPVQVQNTAPSP